MSNSRQSSFLELCLRGEARPDDVDEFVSAWHVGDGDEPLGAFLGMTEHEYETWVVNPGALSAIIVSRREGRPLTDAPKVGVPSKAGRGR
jgi:hypothetical protein